MKKTNKRQITIINEIENNEQQTTNASTSSFRIKQTQTYSKCTLKCPQFFEFSNLGKLDTLTRVGNFLTRQWLPQWPLLITGY